MVWIQLQSSYSEGLEHLPIGRIRGLICGGYCLGDAQPMELNEAQLLRSRGCLGPIACAQFAANIVDVRLSGSRRDE